MPAHPGAPDPWVSRFGRHRDGDAVRDELLIPGRPPLDELDGRALADWLSGWERGVDAAPRLEVRGPPSLHGLAIEEIVYPLDPTGALRVVRVSDVRPDVAGIALTFPIRVVQLGAAQGFPGAARAAEQLLGTIDPDALRVRELPAGSRPEAVIGPDWPTAEMLVVDADEVAATPDLLDTAEPATPGTLGWLARLTSVWQTRLVVLVGAEASRLRQLAVALADRAGPAAAVVDRAHAEAGSALLALYRTLVEDRPLDAAQSHRGALTLVGGAGREDLLRVTRLQVLIGEALPGGDLFLSADTRGVLELGAAVAAAQRDRGVAGRPRPATDPTTGDRHLNVSLRRPGSDGEPELIPQDGPPLASGERCLVAVSIGPEDAEVFTARAAALLEELLLFDPGAEGRWVEVGLTGLGLQVVGDPVREVWLPKGAASVPAAFTVVAGRSPIAAVRVGLYVQHNLVQSVKLAARVGPTALRTDLAAALRLPIDVVGQRAWLPAVEYTLGGDPADHPPRTLSIVANDDAGRKVITVNGPGIFDVTVDADLPATVGAIRRALHDIATPPVPGVTDPEALAYGYGQNNTGRAEKLDRDLRVLATEGWRLYSSAFERQATRDRIAAELATDRRTVHVAHVLVEDAVPWAVAYEREYFPNVTQDGAGDPVEHASCLASLDAGWPTGADCGDDPACLLHPDSAGAGRVLPETVACPRRFWGFRHQVELPVQQAGAGADPPAQATVVGNARPARLLVGSHDGLARTAAHREVFSRWATDPNTNVAVVTDAQHHDDVRAGMADPALDLVYLYCHAEGDKQAGPWPPVLRFAARDPAGELREGRLESSELTGPEWSHRPVVVLNGCGTAAFSVEALSRFVTQFVRGRRAGAVLGTEITMWEQLATEVGASFIQAVLRGETVGSALLRIRRDLLARHNPLGLAYTLYGPAELALASPAAEPAS